MSGDGDTAPRVVEDYRGVIQILSDGTIVRSDPAVLRPPERFPDVPGVQWEDVVYDAAHGLKLRVYRSAAAGGDAGVRVKPKRTRKSVPRESPSQRSSIYRGVTR